MTKQEFEEWLAFAKELAPITYEQEHRKHPLFHQWFQIVKGTTDPDYVQRRTVLKNGEVRLYKPWDKYGANNIGIRMEWLNFDKFINDPVLKPMIANVVSIRNRNRNLDRKKFPNLEVTCIDRKDRTGGFNRENIVFVTKSDLDYDTKTKFVWDSPFKGIYGEPLRLSLRELEAYLIRHKGKPLPEGVGPFYMRQRVWDDEAGRDGKFVTKDIEFSVITPVPLHELRRRARAGITDNRLIAPARDKKPKPLI